MPAVKAPRGGIVISGHVYRGGQWIPASVAAQAPQGALPQKKKFKGGGHGELLARLASHKREMDPKQLDALRRIHDALQSKHGDGVAGRLKTDADALENAHSEAKDEGHKATLKHHLGNIHALAEMASKGEGGSGGKEKGAIPASGGPTQVGKVETTIRVAQGEKGFTASFKEASQDGASAEEAVGKLVMENSEALGLKIQSEESTAQAG